MDYYSNYFDIDSSLADNRKEILYKICPYYGDALFATPDKPVKVEIDNNVVALYPTIESATKIKVVKVENVKPT